MEAWGEEMEAWGEEFEENFASYMTEHEGEWEEWGEKLEAVMEEAFDEDWIEGISITPPTPPNMPAPPAPPAPPTPPNPPSFTAPPAPPAPPSVDLDQEEFLGALEADGLLSKKKNKIIFKDYQMTVNGKKQSQRIHDKYMHMLSDTYDKAFEEGSETNIVLKTQLEDGTHVIRSLSVSTSHKK